MEPLILNIEGMTCNHCVKAVKNSISSLSGVNNINVSLSENNVTLEYDKNTLNKEKIISAITNEGYKVVN
jgi:copper chaperone